MPHRVVLLLKITFCYDRDTEMHATVDSSGFGRGISSSLLNGVLLYAPRDNNILELDKSFCESPSGLVFMWKRFREATLTHPRLHE